MSIITSADLRSYISIDDNIDDAVISWAVDATCASIHAYCGDLREFDKTALVSASARVFRVDYERQLCLVTDFWETTALVVKVDDSNDGSYSTTWTVNTDFVLEPLNGRLHGQTWPYYKIIATGNRFFPMPFYNRPTVQVTAAWGWTAYPAPVIQAALIQGARLFERRVSPQGVLGGSDFGFVRVSNQIDPDVADQLAPYRRPDAFGIA